jgi:hypothetical protein
VAVTKPGTSEADLSTLKEAIAAYFGPTIWVATTSFSKS